MGLDDELEGIMKESSEIGEAFKFLQDDSEDNKGRPKIDMLTRLSQDQITGIIGIDFLEEIGILKKVGSITRKLKRLNVSKDGEGRKELITLGSGMREEKSGNSFFGKLGSAFKRQE